MVSEFESLVAAGRYSPANKTVEGKYTFVDTSDFWKRVCSCLPCSIQLAWPGYQTEAIRATIGDHNVIIQVWKGWCPHLVPDFTAPFVGEIYFPGGIGAEVGIYALTENELEPIAPFSVDDLPINWRTALRSWWDARRARAGSPDNTTLWWPAVDVISPENELSVSFTLHHPDFDAPLIDGYSTATYWTCKWMHEESHERWCAEHRVPTADATVILTEKTNPDEYILDFTVAGIDYRWLDGQIVAMTPGQPDPEMVPPEELASLVPGW